MAKLIMKLTPLAGVLAFLPGRAMWAMFFG